LSILVLEIVLAIIALYLAYTIQYLAISLRGIDLDQKTIPEDLSRFLRRIYSNEISLKMWKREDSSMLIMAALYTPPFKPLIMVDSRFLKEKTDVAKVFLAHEIGHLRRKSQLRVFITAMIALIVVFIAGYFNDILSLLLFPIMISIVFLIYRREEFEADKYAAEVLGVDNVIKVYRYVEERIRGKKSMPKSLIHFTIYVLRKVGIYPSIRSRIEKLSDYSPETSK